MNPNNNGSFPKMHPEFVWFKTSFTTTPHCMGNAYIKAHGV